MDEKIIDIIAKILKVSVSEISLGTIIGDIPEWDSLHHVAIIVEIERTFDIKFKPEDLMELEDVSDIITLIKGPV